jgi:broad specificity phosphatase PhoE
VNDTTIVIARHGTTEWNEKGIMQGVADSPLTKEGIKLAEELGKELRKYKFDVIFSSDLLRAKKTAEILALEHKLDVHTTELLREKSFGKYEGQPYAKYHQEVDLLFDKLSEEEKMSYKHADDMESYEETAERFFKFIREIALLTPGRTILAVSHGAFIRAVLIKLGFSTFKDISHGNIDNGSYIVLETDGIDFLLKEHQGIRNLNYAE